MSFGKPIETHQLRFRASVCIWRVVWVANIYIYIYDLMGMIEKTKFWKCFCWICRAHIFSSIRRQILSFSIACSVSHLRVLDLAKWERESARSFWGHNVGNFDVFELMGFGKLNIFVMCWVVNLYWRFSIWLIVICVKRNFYFDGYLFLFQFLNSRCYFEYSYQY